MSHFTKVTTKLRNATALQKALTRMGINFETGQFTITQYGKSEKAEIKLDQAVGLSLQADGTYAMVGDFYHSKNDKLRRYYGRNQQFSGDLTTAYAVEEAKEQLELQNYYCTENSEAKIGDDGLIRMVYESYS